MNIGFATMEKIDNRMFNSVGSSRIRARWLINYWENSEEYKVGKKYDVMIFQKAYWQEMMEKFDGIKIFDLCDPDWLVPRPVVQVMDYCHAMVTSTEELAHYVRKFVTDKPVICIPDRLDLAEHKPRGVHEGRAERICWFGYHQNVHYIQNCFDFLIERNLKLTIISDLEYSTPPGYSKLDITNVNYSYESVHDEIKKHDMVLLPSTNSDLKGKFKSNNKTLTAYALGVPVVKEPQDLDMFMSADARNHEAAMREVEVREEWDVKQSVKEYKALIKQLQETQ